MVAALVTALLAVTSLAAAADAASFSIVFRVDAETSVTGTASHDFRIQHRGTGGAVVQQFDVDIAGNGQYEVCFDDDMSAGHQLRAFRKSGGPKVSFTIPMLTVRTDRVADKVKGSAPANKQVKVRLYDCSRLTFMCVHKGTATVPVNKAGKYARDMTSIFDGRGFDEARVTFTGSAGHP